jgi:cytochrome c
MKCRVVVAALVSSLVLARVAPAFAQGDVGNGRIVFNQKCASCHTMSADGTHSPKGPNLMGVIGRTAGSIAGWEFSPALRASGLEFHPRNTPMLVWTEENLDKWLMDPAVFVPGSRMDLKMPNRVEREDVIAYLRTVPRLPSQK